MSDQLYGQINRRCCVQCDNGGAGSLDDASDRPALWADRARLVDRIAEIDALLNQPMPAGIIKL